MTLYDDLGVGPKATPAEIKAARRRKAKANHPDTGGARAAFDVAEKAYRVLGDPTRRLIYDKTGQENEEPTRRLQVAIEMITGLLVNLVDSDDSVDVDHLDIRQGLMHGVESILQDHYKSVIAARRRLNRITVMRRRFLREPKPGADLVGNALGAQLFLAERTVANLEEKIEAIKLAKTILADYSYKWDHITQPGFQIKVNR